MKNQKSSKKYICSFCARPFSRSEHKLRHERSHTNTKPFNCTNCSSSFVRRDLMQRHLRTVHKIDLKNIVSTDLSNGHTSLTSLSGDIHNSHNHKTPVNGSANDTHHMQTITKDVNEITQLLKWSKSHQNLNVSLESQISTLFFFYGTSNIPIKINEENIYACLCYSASFINLNDTIKLFHKAMSYPSLQSLSILAWTYLINFDLLNKNLIPIDVVFTQLDSLLCSTTIVPTAFNDESSQLMWFMNSIQAQYVLKFNKQPPLSYSSIFLKQKIDNKSLIEWLKILSKSSNMLPSSPKHLRILLDCLIMELQNLKFNSKNKNSTNADQLNKIESHNSIIMFNKFYISKLIQFGHLYNNNDDSSSNSNQFSKIFMISKRNLLLNVPQSFQDIIVDYVLIPYDANHINLLHLTLREFQYWNSIQPLLLPSSSSSSNNNYMTITNWFNWLRISTINNNLGLIAYPLIVLGSLPLELSNFNSNNDEYTNFKNLNLEIFLILIKVFHDWDSLNIEDLKENVVLKGVVYLILEMSSNDKLEVNYNDFENEFRLKNLKIIIIDKLFNILLNWVQFYQLSISEDLIKFKSSLLNNESTPPELHSPISNSPDFRTDNTTTITSSIQPQVSGSSVSSSSSSVSLNSSESHRNSSNSSNFSNDFSIITSPPSNMNKNLDDFNLHPHLQQQQQNYTYFPKTFESKIRLPPLNILTQSVKSPPLQSQHQHQEQQQQQSQQLQQQQQHSPSQTNALLALANSEIRASDQLRSSYTPITQRFNSQSDYQG